MHHCYHITEYNFDYIFTITREFYTALCFYDVNFSPFISTQGTPCSISCKAGLVVINFLSFSLFGKVFILPTFLKDSFAGHSIFG